MFQAATSFKILSVWTGFFISCYLSRSRSSAYLLKMCINNREVNLHHFIKEERVLRYTVLPVVSAISAMICAPKYVRSDSEENIEIGYLSNRVSTFDSDNYRPGLEENDVFYPPWYIDI